MSFINSITGNIPHSELIITETNVSADNGSFTNLSAVNASFVNLSTTTFTPININSSLINVSDVNASSINTSIVNISTAYVSDLILNELELVNLSVDNISNDIIDTEVINIKSNNNLLPNAQIRKLNNDVLLKLGDATDIGTFSIQPDGITTKLNFNDGILTINNSIHTSSIDGGLYLFSDSNLSQDKSRIYREGNVLKIAQGEFPGDADASIHFYIGPPTGTPPLKIDKNNNKTTTIDFVSDDLFSLRGTINTFHSSSIASPAIEGDEIETKNLLFNDKITSNDSYFERVNNIFRFVGSSGATPVDWEFYKTSGVNPLVKIEASNDTMTIDGSLVADISQNLVAGTGIQLSTASGITTITNTGSITDPLNVSQLNASNISTVNLSASNDITALEVRGTAIVSSPILEGGFVDTLTGDISNLSSVSMNASEMNASTVNSSAIATNTLFAQTSIYGGTVDADILEALYELHITDKTTGTSNQTIIHRFSNYFDMYNTNVIAPYKFYTGTNTGTPDLEITSTGIVADISQNLLAGTGIQLSTASGITTITNTGLITDPLNVSQLNASNISVDNLSASNDITALEVRGTAIVSSPILEGGFVDTLTGDISNLSCLNISLNNLTFTTSISGSGIINTTGIIQTSGTINGGTLNGNIAGNLSAGTGISLNTVGNITTITNTGSITDPLNVSQLNASNISVDNLSVSNEITATSVKGDIFSNLSAGGGITLTQNTPTAGITQINATGLSTSTQYAFKAYSTSGDAYSINGATTIPYNSLAPQTGYDGYSIPNTSSYNTAQATYTIPVSGYWYVGYTLRQRTTSTTNALVAIYRNGSIYMINGNYTGNNEGMSINLYADAGDLIYVRSISGSFSVDMRPTAAMFYGFLLQPVNNSVSASTDLSIQNLSVSGDITATSITADLSTNLTAGLNMDLSTTAGNTTINSAQQIYCLSLTNNITPGAAVTGRSLIYDTIKYDSGGGVFVYEPLTGEIEITLGGNYCISAAVNIKNVSYTDRVNFRIRFRLNGSWFLGYPQAYSYSRHQNYARYATSVITDYCTPLNAGDKIDIYCNVAKAQNSNFTSDFGGLQLFNGATFTIKRI
jgi:hypothetical protein